MHQWTFDNNNWILKYENFEIRLLVNENCTAIAVYEKPCNKKSKLIEVHLIDPKTRKEIL